MASQLTGPVAGGPEFSFQKFRNFTLLIEFWICGQSTHGTPVAGENLLPCRFLEVSGQLSAYLGRHWPIVGRSRIFVGQPESLDTFPRAPGPSESFQRLPAHPNALHCLPVAVLYT